MAIPQSFLQELVARADVVEIIGRYVPLKKAGANFMGLCPFHGEKSPSFSVSPTKQFYHCFGCGKSGDAIRFLMEHTGLAFIEAVGDLAQQYGMQVPQEDVSPQELARAKEQRERQHTLVSVLEKAGEAYRNQLKNSPKAIAYFKQRGLSGKIAKHFGLGYAPEGWRSLAGVFADYDDPLLVESGLVISSSQSGSTPAIAQDEAAPGPDHLAQASPVPATVEKRYDRFRDRVMFPIRNIKGECIGFGGRVLGDEKPKYLNSPETPVFSKGHELYGLFEARNAIREAGYALVTEGYMDVVALAQLGFPNAVATLGTACTHEHVQKLFRFTDGVVFSFDGDAAGRRAARKALDSALPFATDVRNIKFLFLPQEHDPDSFIRAHGKEAFARYVQEATPLSRFLTEVAGESCDLGTAEGRARLSSNAKPLWTRLPEGALKLQLLSEIAQQVQIGVPELSALWIPAVDARAPREPAWRKAPGGAQTAGPAAYTRRSAAQRMGMRVQPTNRADHAARILLNQSGLWEQLGNEDHAMLCALPAPHGPLFVWLETQLHEHGPVTWSVLQPALHQEPFYDAVMRLMLRDTPLSGAADDAKIELHDVLNRLHLDGIEALSRQAADQSDVAQLKLLDARRRALTARMNAESEAIMPP